MKKNSFFSLRAMTFIIGVLFSLFTFTACTQTPTGDEMAPYRSIAIRPMRGVTPDIAARLPAGFENNVAEALSVALTNKGYKVVGPADAADLSLFPIFQAGTRPNPVNSQLSPAQGTVFQAKTDTGTLNFYLKNNMDSRVFQTSTGTDMPFSSFTRYYLTGAAGEAFAELPAKQSSQATTPAR